MGLVTLGRGGSSRFIVVSRPFSEVQIEDHCISHIADLMSKTVRIFDLMRSLGYGVSYRGVAQPG